MTDSSVREFRSASKFMKPVYTRELSLKTGKTESHLNLIYLNFIGCTGDAPYITRVINIGGLSEHLYSNL